VSAPLVVLKFGSSVLPNTAALVDAVHEIYRHLRAGKRVLAVVSALGSRTDELLQEARSVASEPAPESLAALLATGERAAVELLALALAHHGLPAHALAPESAGLSVAGPSLDALPIALDTATLWRRLAERAVLVVPGFVGLDESGRVALLGRGGSDLSALFLAHALGAERCVLLKDVDGLYERDPALPGPRPRRFAELSFERALALEGGIVQKKAIAFAASRGFPFEVGALGSEATTRVGVESPRLGTARLEPGAPRARLRVALAGLGAVGGGVCVELLRRADRFELVGVASRRLDGAGSVGVARELWRADGAELLALEPDVLVELTGSRAAERWIRVALGLGIDVVTAHKDFVAREQEELEALAQASGARLCFSAAVGGALAALESVTRLARCGPLRSLAGVLNATSNFVLSLGERGSSLEDALRAARARGLVEQDATRDLEGYDAASKLALLARAAFGVSLAPSDVVRVSVDDALLRRARHARGSLERVRVLARAVRTPQGVSGALVEARLPEHHPLAAEGLENRLLITPEHGPPELLCAAGAGRAPTSLAVLADLHDLWRASSRRRALCAREVRA